MDSMGSDPWLSENPTGLTTLGISVVMAVLNGVWFGFATFASQFPITAEAPDGLFFNVIAAIIGWIAFIRGKRLRFLHQLAAVIMLGVVHYYLISNIRAVIVAL